MLQVNQRHGLTHRIMVENRNKQIRDDGKDEEMDRDGRIFEEQRELLQPKYTEHQNYHFYGAMSKQAGLKTQMSICKKHSQTQI